MCGLGGILSYRGPIGVGERDAVGRMCEAMRSRGPDGQGAWLSPDGRLALGHRRLSVIDLSSDGAQPFTSVDGRFTIAFNGEIYNHRQLRADLTDSGAVFRSRSDTEVVLEAYRRFGTSAFGRLRGMFALAIWDDAERRLVLARDPFGIKPLYVAESGRTLLFASQVKALVASREVPLEMEPAGQVGFFIWGHLPEPFTLFRAIRAFPPGHHQAFNRDGAAEAVCFASPRDILIGAEEVAREVGGAERRAIIQDRVLDSIAAHHVADVPVGVLLSAGIDSTVIAAASAQAIGPGTRTLTLGFEAFRGSHKDETASAEATARRLETSHITRWVRSRDLGTACGALFEAMDQPSIDGVNTYLVSKLASEAGLKVVLSGIGGDELFGGYPSFRDVPRLARIAGAIPAAERIGRSLRAAAAGWAGRFASPKWAGLLEYGSTFFGAYLLRRALFMPWELPGLLDPDLVRVGLDRLQLSGRGEEALRGISSPHAAVALLELTHYLRDRLLRDADWASMAHSIELRVPFVDWSLFEALAPLIVSGTPPRKADLAAAVPGGLPAGSLRRAKRGFEVPVPDWLNANAGLAGRMADRGLRDWSRTISRAFVPA